MPKVKVISEDSTPDGTQYTFRCPKCQAKQMVGDDDFTIEVDYETNIADVHPWFVCNECDYERAIQLKLQNT